MKKLLIAVFVAGAVPALAAPPHQKPGLVHQSHASTAFERGGQEHASDARSDRRASSERAKASEPPKADHSPYDQR